MSVANLGVNVVSKVLGDLAQVEKLEQMAQVVAEQRSDLQNYESAIGGLMKPYTESILTDLKGQKDKMNGSSQARLAVQQWNVLSTLRGYNSFLQDFAKAFPDVAAKFNECVKELEEAVKLMVNLYENIQDYLDQIQFSSYIANILMLSVPAYDFEPRSKEDIMYEKVEKALLGSMLVSEWEVALQNFCQWVFPFTKEFDIAIKPRPLKDYLSDNVKNSFDAIDLLLPDVQTWVTELRQKIGYYKSTLYKPMDDVLHRAEFNSRGESVDPFYVWKPEDNRELIKKVLSGEKVTISIFPDYSYEKNKTAVKFTIAEIEIKARNKSIQNEIDGYLKLVKVNMTHSGVSRYLYEDEAFEFRAESQIISYHFERGSDGERIDTNTVYKKLKTGDVMLSPYTIWTIQFLQASTTRVPKFDKLKRYAPFVDMELVGVGSYVSLKPKVIEGRSRNGHKHRKGIKHRPLYFNKFTQGGWSPRRF